MSPLTFLITGASSGLGLSIALHALRAGHKVVGTSRNISNARSSNSSFEELGGTWEQIDPSSLQSADGFRKLGEKYEIDVLINCAGYAMLGAVEDVSEEELRDQMEANFYGPIRVVKAFLPQMRARKSGTIVLMSSGAGFLARPSRSAYSASKFAIEAVHESLAAELSTFNIRVLIVEPGAFRTAFAERCIVPKEFETMGGYSEVYRGTSVEKVFEWGAKARETGEGLKGDPEKAARAVVEAVTGKDGGDEAYLRLVLGPDCVKAMEEKIRSLQSDLDTTKDVAMGTDL